MSQPPQRESSQSSSDDDEIQHNNELSQQIPSQQSSRPKKNKPHDPNAQFRSTKVASAFQPLPHSYDGPADFFDYEQQQNPQVHPLPIQLANQTHDLITTGLYNADIDNILTNIHTLQNQANIWMSIDVPSFAAHGIYRDASLQTTCQFYLKLYQDSNQEIVLYCTRQQGCGIAFSRFFKQLNMLVSNDPQRHIWTFDPPELVNPTTFSSNEMNQPEENVFSFSNSQIQTATSTITNFFKNITDYRKQCAENLLKPVPVPNPAPIQRETNTFSFSNIGEIPLTSAPVQLGKSIEQLKKERDDFYQAVQRNRALQQQQQVPTASSSIPPSVDAQAHMFNQSFELLNDFLDKTDDLTGHDTIIAFAMQILTPAPNNPEANCYERYPMLMFFLSFPVISVRASFVQFLSLIVPSFLSYIAQDNNIVVTAARSALDFSNISPYDQLYRSQIHQYLERIDDEYRL